MTDPKHSVMPMIEPHTGMTTNPSAASQKLQQVVEGASDNGVSGSSKVVGEPVSAEPTHAARTQYLEHRLRYPALGMCRR